MVEQSCYDNVTRTPLFNTEPCSDSKSVIIVVEDTSFKYVARKPALQCRQIPVPCERWPAQMVSIKKRPERTFPLVPIQPAGQVAIAAWNLKVLRINARGPE